MKKPSVVSFLITFLLAAAVCTHGNEFVKLVTDEDGNPVEVGVKYFIQPQDSVGGGLAPSQDSNEIIETFEPNDLGRPVVFEFLYVTRERFIPLDSAVTIEFMSFLPPIWPPLPTYTFWKVNVSSSAIVLVNTPMDENSLFRIEEAGEAGTNTYKFTTSIGPVGTKRVSHAIGAAELLVVTNDTSKPLLVKFRKDATTATTSTSRVEKFLRMFPFY